MIAPSTDATETALSIHDVLAQALSNPEAGWSMGSFGALAEFHQDNGEAPIVDAADELTRATPRGGIQLDPAADSTSQPIAYEQLSKDRQRWGQGLALCLPVERCTMSQRTVLTQVGADQNAICPDHKDDVLFDMGLGLVQCDFHVRARDPELIAVLSENEGKSIFDSTNPAMAAILKAHPHRVATTRLGRVEVHQKIGGPDTDSRSPLGPHTHVLPKLMRAGKTHAGNITIPPELVPCAYLHPGNPLIDGIGARRPYNRDLAQQFDKIYGSFAPRDLRDVKQEVRHAISEGITPADFKEPGTRAGRITMRVVLRQLFQETDASGNAKAATHVQAWQQHFEPVGSTQYEETDEQADYHGA